MPLIFVGWSIGEMMSGLIINYVRDWRKIQLFVIAINCLLLLPGLYYLTESARFTCIRDKNKGVQ